MPYSEFMLTLNARFRGRSALAMRALIGATCFVTYATHARAEPSLDPQLWSQQGAALTVTDAAGPHDLFGGAVAVSSDRIVVGAPGHSLYGHINEGAVYSFE